MDNTAFVEPLFVTPIWMIRLKTLSMFIKAGILASFDSQKKVRDCMHTGQGHFPCVHQPQNNARAGRSCREVWYQTYISKCSLFEASNVRIPRPSQPRSKSSTSGSRYTFMFLPGYFGPGIIIETNMFRGITNTGQQLYTEADMPYGLNPS